MFTGQDSGTEKKGAKQGLSAKVGAQRRERHLQQVRHRAAGDALRQLRRQEDDNNGENMGEGGKQGDDYLSKEVGPMDVWAYDKSSPPHTVPLGLLPQCAQLASCGTTPKEIFQGILLIRKMLSVEKSVPFKEVIESGVISHMVQHLANFEFPDLQFECAWAITNLLADPRPDSSAVVMSCGAIPRLIEMLKSPSEECVDQSIWALGNLAGESTECRDACLEMGAMPEVLRILTAPNRALGTVRNAVWTASNLCRGRPQPSLEMVGMAAPVLANLLNHSDFTVVVDAAWGLSYISDGPADRVQVLIEANVIHRIVELLSSPSSTLKTPALRIIGNVASGDDQQTQTIINAGALAYFHELLRHSKRAIRKEICWTISNISAGQPEQIDALINSGVFAPLFECLSAPELDVKKEAVWAIANVAFCGTPAQTKFLVNSGVIPLLCEALRVYDAKIATVALEALQVMLQYGEEDMKAGLSQDNVIATEMYNCAGVENIEQLQTHSDPTVYNLALNILENFFNAGEEEIGGGAGGMVDLGLEEQWTDSMQTDETAPQGNTFQF